MTTKPGVIEAMTRLGVYKPEFDPTIERYVALKQEYTKIYKQYKAAGYEFQIETKMGVKKSPIIITLETLRKDLLAMEESLGLTPKGLTRLQEKALEKPKKSKLGDLV